MPVMLDEGRDLIFHLWDVHGYLPSCRVSQRGINDTGMLENSRLTQKILHFIVIQINSDPEREGKGVFSDDFNTGNRTRGEDTRDQVVTGIKDLKIILRPTGLQKSLLRSSEG